jgi:hypothetical protein
MAAPFTKVEVRTSWLDRLLPPKGADAAETAVRQLLGSAARIRDVPSHAVESTCVRHGVASVVDLGMRRAEMYGTYLRHCLDDHVLTDEELAELDHLQEILELPSSSIDLIHRRVARDVYARTVDDVLADDAVDPQERDFLRRLRQRLDIPEAVAENILDVKQRQRAARRDPLRRFQSR